MTITLVKVENMFYNEKSMLFSFQVCKQVNCTPLSSIREELTDSIAF